MERGGVTVEEIAPEALEDELRAGRRIVVLDTRDRESFSIWRVDEGAHVRSVPEAELAEDGERLLADIPESAQVRVICYSGVGSRRVAASLAGRFDELLSVSGGMIGWSRVLQSSPVPLTGPFRVVQLRRESRGCLSYVVAVGDEALVVDPAPAVERYLEEAEALGARITRVLDTHVHADHLSGARELAARTGAPLHLSRAALRRGVTYAAEVSPVADGAVLALGEEAVRILALPGHTSDMTGVLLGDAALIGGDCLFLDSVARPDLEVGSERADEAARELHATLAERVGALGDDVLLLPAHYAGGRLEGPHAATLGDVRRDVADLALEREEFVTRILDRLPSTPTNHQSIIAVNLGEDLPADEVARLEVGANRCAATTAWSAPSA